MKTIEPKTYKSLRETFLESGFFNDDIQLQAIFTDDRISPWRYRLPQANNPLDRVDLTIALLHGKRRSDTKTNALVLLLQVLSERIDSKDELHLRFIELMHNLQDNEKDPSFIPSEEMLSIELVDSRVSQLRTLLVERLATSEIKDICFDLEIDVENLSVDNKSDQVRNLIIYCRNRKWIYRLIQWIQHHRPDIDLSFLIDN